VLRLLLSNVPCLFTHEVELRAAFSRVRRDGAHVAFGVLLEPIPTPVLRLLLSEPCLRLREKLRLAANRFQARGDPQDYCSALLARTGLSSRSPGPSSPKPPSLGLPGQLSKAVLSAVHRERAATLPYIKVPDPSGCKENPP
jgi:hypothetical protein